ncbi:HAD-IA family hydrolase [Microbacterium sp. zg.B48]|uniref:HAD family hydrolase n=1 Tax=unclassified Microbacterium TaxID=2609290 RepID=UPI00214BCFEB|nr:MULTISPECIES: HAD-IA family hydrolase [unclassified Microbacterium]MCR2763879.1 HAD-IA family hydrolase [Microbacterium sp. zg.B48]MCR2811361.1 HAD-IA family hydrolase [Microbacterium sp. zg.B185]WIM18357.1 HAD-IA family hydrolase [Microbacterium sp. zg-B185]
MTVDAPPDLTSYDAVLFDLDGVLTPTAEVHMHAWQTMFEELFAAWDITPPYTERDYFDYLDGKKRYDGVASLLRSRDVEVPWGDPADPPTADTVCGIGNRKNEVFSRLLRAEGIVAYPGSVALLDELDAAGTPTAVVSSSKNAEEVLQSAGLRARFPVVMDGVIAERDHLASKPAPDVFVEAARMLGVDPARSAAIEDAISGVQSAAAGGFALVIGVDRGTGPDELRRAGAHVVVDDLAALVRRPESSPQTDAQELPE